jgi:hypothetical protein
MAFLATPQTVCVVERVPRLVSQDAQAAPQRPTFDLEHLLMLESHQPGVRQVERHRETRHAIGTKELVREPDVWSKGDTAPREIAKEISRRFSNEWTHGPQTEVPESKR